MRDKLFHPTAIGGYGTIIVTLVIFFAQGGFGVMTPLSCLYIIGLAVGIGLILYSVIKPIQSVGWLKLRKVIPILHKMDNRLIELTKREAKQKIDWVKFNEISTKINGELGIKLEMPNNLEELENGFKSVYQYVNKNYISDDVKHMLFSLENISLMLDTYGFGLKGQREIDKEYKKLNKSLENLRNIGVMSHDLNKLIRIHISTSETLANLSLLGKRSISTGITNYMPIQQRAFAESGFEPFIKEYMNSIRSQITECIQQSEVTQNDISNGVKKSK